MLSQRDDADTERGKRCSESGMVRAR